MHGQPVVARRIGRRQRQHSEAVPAGELGTRWRDRPHHRDLEIGVGLELEHRLLAGEPLRVMGHGLPGEQAQDHVKRLLHPRSQLGRVHAVHQRVGGQLTGSDAEHHAAAREVIQQHHPLGHLERMVVGQ